jgi:hypothetical protein
LPSPKYGLGSSIEEPDQAEYMPKPSHAPMPTRSPTQLRATDAILSPPGLIIHQSQAGCSTGSGDMGGAGAARSVWRSTVNLKPCLQPHLDPMPLPKFEHHDAPPRTHVDRDRQAQMTASSPRGTFSQAELTAELGDNPLYHPFPGEFSATEGFSSRTCGRWGDRRPDQRGFVGCAARHSARVLPRADYPQGHGQSREVSL